MRIKTKLNLGVGLLFVLIIVLSLVSAFYIYSIKKDTQNILKANYETLEYSRNMLSSLDEIEVDETKAIVLFETNLKKQIANITEVGEDKVTYDLQRKFQILEQDRSNATLKSQIRNDIFEIMKLNMNAIKVKSDIAKKTAETANLWIAIVGSLCFLLRRPSWNLAVLLRHLLLFACPWRKCAGCFSPTRCNAS